MDDGRGGGHGSRLQELSGGHHDTLLCKVAWKDCRLSTAVCFLGCGTLTKAIAVPDPIVWGVLVPLAAPASFRAGGLQQGHSRDHLVCILQISLSVILTFRLT